MSNEIQKFEVGKDYQTRGGWKAKCIWACNVSSYYYFIHNPGENNESSVIAHDYFGKSMTALAVNEPPCYNGHPADILGEWINNVEECENETL